MNDIHIALFEVMRSVLAPPSSNPSNPSSLSCFEPPLWEGVGGGPSSPSSPFSSPTDLSTFIAFATQQGVAGIVAQAVKNCDEHPVIQLINNTPQKKMEFLLSLTEQENDYKKKKEALSSLLTSHHCFVLSPLYGRGLGEAPPLTSPSEFPNFLLLKGISLSQYWPVPQHRPCGDIDIMPVTIHTTEEGTVVPELDNLRELVSLVDAAVESQGVTVEAKDNNKHTKFMWQGVQIENHFALAEQARLFGFGKANDLLMASMQKYGLTPLTSSLYTLSPSSQYIYFIVHMLIHLFSRETILLRHFVDIALYLDAHRHDIDVEGTNHIIREMGYSRVKDIFLHIAHYLTGIDLSFLCETTSHTHDAPAPCELTPIERRVMREMLRQDLTKKPGDDNPQNHILRFFKIFVDHGKKYWMYRLIEHSFYTDLWDSISVSVRHYIHKTKDTP